MEKKTPLFHIVKRDTMPLWKAWAVRLASILLALVVCAVFINSVTGLNPLSVYASMFDGAFGTGRRIWNTVNDAMILLCIALAITPAFKMRFWNIGAEGQILVGGAATAAVMRYCGDSLPTPALFALMVVVSLLCGLVWGLVPAWFKARWNTNETLFTQLHRHPAGLLPEHQVGGRQGQRYHRRYQPEHQGRLDRHRLPFRHLWPVQLQHQHHPDPDHHPADLCVPELHQAWL